MLLNLSNWTFTFVLKCELRKFPYSNAIKDFEICKNNYGFLTNFLTKYRSSKKKTTHISNQAKKEANEILLVLTICLYTISIQKDAIAVGKKVIWSTKLNISKIYFSLMCFVYGSAMANCTSVQQNVVRWLFVRYSIQNTSKTSKCFVEHSKVRLFINKHKKKIFSLLHSLAITDKCTNIKQ